MGIAVGAVVGTGVEVGATVGVVSVAVVGVGVATSEVGVDVISGVPSEVGVVEATGTTVRPVAVVAAVAGVVCTSETTAGLARLQPASRATTSRVRATTASVFFFMVISSLIGKSNGG